LARGTTGRRSGAAVGTDVRSWAARCAIDTGFSRGTANGVAVARLSRWTARSSDTGFSRGAAGRRSGGGVDADVRGWAARCAIDTGFSRGTANSVAVARPSAWAARATDATDTNFARLTATGVPTHLTRRAARCAIETGLARITANFVAAVARTTIGVRTARRAGILTAYSALAGVARWATHTRAALRIAGFTLALVAGSRQTNRAADVGRRAAPALHTTLARGTAAAGANLATGTARSIHARLPGIAANPMAAIVRATVSALAAVVACRNAGSADSVLANLARRAAVRASVAGAKAAAVFSDTANRRWARPTPIATLVTKAAVLGSVSRALLCRWRTATKDRVAPTLAGIGPALSTEEAANAAKTNQAADRRGDNCFQRMPS
jgi:hypothetical protein